MCSSNTFLALHMGSLVYYVSLMTALFAGLSVYLGYVFVNVTVIEETGEVCWKNLTFDGKLVCRPKCRNGSFSLPSMKSCRPWLKCSDIDEVRPQNLLFKGVVKNVYLAQWNGLFVVMSTLSMDYFEEDFQHNIKMLKAFGPSPYIVQLIGYCNNTVVTEYHRLGSAINVNSLLTKKFNYLDNVITRLSFCIHYVNIIAFLHNSPVGTRVMCDSNSLLKTLSQYLITEDFNLVLNDLDALPEVNHSIGKKIKCGHLQVTGDFVAPEQQWPYLNETYNDERMPHYDEKSDVWKLPNVCNWFLGQDRKSDSIKFMLFKIHKQCKENIPHERPTALNVLAEYKIVLSEIT